MRPRPEPGIISWLDNLPAESVWTTSITVFEIRMGLDLLETGRRRRALEQAFQGLLDELEQRVLVFDTAAALSAGALAAERRRVGRPLDFRDIQIAGIVKARRASLATRNVRHFEGLGLEILDPLA